MGFTREMNQLNDEALPSIEKKIELHARRQQFSTILKSVNYESSNAASGKITRLKLGASYNRKRTETNAQSQPLTV